ncbi:serine protease [Luteibacter sp. 1214]|uniref:S8 family serine peptidase n=1 Tax=Luteibacter sp. 1214 TaxID=2817735 RepID=UPI0028561815|nr:S8 family serine peptidase [Luteibacter sp. 1214]MDR6642071.1 serine protease [Luteibacter sp. 1214]
MVNRIVAGTFVASLLLGVAPGIFATGADAPRATFDVSSLRAPGGYDRFIVTYRDGTTERVSASAAAQSVGAALSRTAGTSSQLRAGKGAAIQAVYGRKLATGSDLIRTSRKLTRTEADTLIRQIAADPAVKHVEPDAMMQKIDDIRATDVTPVVVNDPYYAGYQWHFRPPTGTAEKIGSDATSYANRGGSNVANAWNLADGTGVTVAVLDTGITQHPDIDLSLADAGYDFISDGFVSGRSTDARAPGGWDTGDWTTEDKYLLANGGCIDPSAGDEQEDSSWHGTHVSGTIAELSNNATGMAGVAYKAKVLPVRVLGHCGGYTSDIADAIVWASGGHVDGVPDNAHPAQVINMSLGGGGSCADDAVTSDAIASAISRGTTVVVAAGNSGADATNYSPASCPGALTVASNGIAGKRAYYSNYGSKVALSAPGGGIYANDGTTGSPVQAGFIWSAINNGTHEPTTAAYGGMAGTSQATPHVAGSVALILSATRAAGVATPTPAEIRTLLTSTATPFPVTPDKAIGAGILDAYAAVNKALGNDAPGEPGDGDATALSNGVALTGQTGRANGTLVYRIDVPAGARSLALRSFGGSGDVSLYVKNGEAASSTAYDYRSVKPSTNNEAVTVARPAAGTWYVTVVGVKDFANVTVQASFTAP